MSQMTSSAFSKSRFKPKTTSINVLVIGESGVGKSTFINALANYLTYNSLEHAEKNQLICKIPASFTITDDNFKPVNIKVGPADTNELHVTGKAATQGAKTHKILHENLEINIIDSAGIGDPDGFQKDQENLKNLIKHISQIPTLNAICFLLKPNSARLEIKFRYCLNEILGHLDKQAVANIAFCFTCSTITAFKPGDSFPILRQFMDSIEYSGTIDKSNIFFFDNESFRYLAAKSCGITYLSDERQQFLSSWNKSSDNAKRLIGYISNLKPYNTVRMVNLDRGRSVLLKLSKVIIETVNVIETNLKQCEKYTNELEKMENKLVELSDDTNEFEQVLSYKERIKNLKFLINQINKVVNGYLDEQEEILKVCVKCAGYTKDNAIVAFNDALIDYLDIIIEDEKGKVMSGADESVLNNLRNVKKHYLDLKKQFFETHRHRGNNDDNNIDDLNTILHKLCGFRNTGKLIKELLENS